MIPNIAEYVDVDPQHELLLDLYEKVKGARAGEDFNVNSSQQLAQILFDKLEHKDINLISSLLINHC